MAGHLSRAVVNDIAALARLALTVEERELYLEQLGRILAYAQHLADVPTDGVPPTAGLLTEGTAERPDEPRPSMTPAGALANAPDRALGAALFRAPRVIGE